MPRQSFSVEFYLFLLCALIALNVSVYQTIFAPDTFKITVFEAGRGIATLVQSPSKKTLLIDTGSDASILRELGMTLPEWERSIDAIILTGTKTSFRGGLAAIESRYTIPSPRSVGDQDTPYGIEFTVGSADITIISAGIFSISHGDDAFLISSSTPPGTYTLQ